MIYRLYDKDGDEITWKPDHYRSIKEAVSDAEYHMEREGYRKNQKITIRNNDGEIVKIVRPCK